MEGVITLKDLVTAVAFGGLAPLVAYQLVERLKEVFPSYTVFGMRTFAVVIACVIALVGWFGGISFGYFAPPSGDWRAWIEAMFAVVMPVITVSQLGHAARKRGLKVRKGTEACH